MGTCLFALCPGIDQVKSVQQKALSLQFLCDTQWPATGPSFTGILRDLSKLHGCEATQQQHVAELCPTLINREPGFWAKFVFV
jgi:hypothetical protein